MQLVSSQTPPCLSSPEGGCSLSPIGTASSPASGLGTLAGPPSSGAQNVCPQVHCSYGPVAIIICGISVAN